jgi:hypothetical protein
LVCLEYVKEKILKVPKFRVQRFRGSRFGGLEVQRFKVRRFRGSSFSAASGQQNGQSNQ